MADMAPSVRVLHKALAQKLLHSWAQNRQQVLVPLTLNLARMPPAQKELMAATMAAALAARGTEEGIAERLATAWRRAGGEVALPAPPDLFALVARLEAEGLGAHAYAAAALLLDRRIAVERAFLDWLAARFRLPANLTAGLARRYRL
jgi:uncharacterized membrane protein YebE (DUF533 family)